MIEASSTSSRYALYRLGSTVGGKLADAVGVVIAIKTLAPADYGIVGTALGLMAIIGYLNLSPEDILWRDYPRLRDRLPQHLSAFVWFWWWKLLAAVVVAVCFAAVTGAARGSWYVGAAVLAAAVSLQALTALTLVEVPLFAGLEAGRGMGLVLAVRGVWLVLLLPNFWFRSLPYYLFALGTYAVVTVALTLWQLRARWGVRLGSGREAFPIVREAVLEFTLWLHLIGRSRIFLQRGILAILSFCGVSLVTLGQVTVAVNLVSFALIIPSVLENVAAVNFARVTDDRMMQLRRLVGIATLLATAQCLVGWTLAPQAIAWFLGTSASEAVRFFRALLVGSSVFVAFSPVFAYAICYRKMRQFFLCLFLPVAIACAIVVSVATVRFGVYPAVLAQAILWASAGIGMMVYVLISRRERVVPPPPYAESATDN